ncbi:hypothetical protein [Ralstonia pseudosolanacearum]|uniref:Uncharacterized protein n=1 Tax=Ralstonia solanacearum TaxID=305 RepID=A0AA92JQX3_RALSL|nr:hypothetical protein [Ralstonia pseudosolanacearum]QOK91085.1 hypothetical protein HF908_06055 [Ralstonia pseudosolanacearum]QOK97364.1 hypothetical protein HF909_13600 [Ralstonia pseudosolanacearum]UWD92119.1 hypothetical protein NY025_14185 [Ralstonia pseudosolanacearum]CAH0444077.1 hypothetical protein LMG9673_04275 [Ralstonia pseudosolanacearum]
MANIRRTFIATIFTALAWASLALAASPSGNTDHDHNHPQKKAAPPVATVAQQSNADFDAQIAHLRAIRERLARAYTPEERRALMDERMKVMQDMMASMRRNGGMKSLKGKNETAQAAMCQGMMDRHMDMMQEMMQMMMDGQGMGTGGAMGPGMGGMMSK